MGHWLKCEINRVLTVAKHPSKRALIQTKQAGLGFMQRFMGFYEVLWGFWGVMIPLKTPQITHKTS